MGSLFVSSALFAPFPSMLCCAGCSRAKAGEDAGPHRSAHKLRDDTNLDKCRMCRCSGPSIQTSNMFCSNCKICAVCCSKIPIQCEPDCNFSIYFPPSTLEGGHAIRIRLPANFPRCLLPGGSIRATCFRCNKCSWCAMCCATAIVCEVAR